MKNEEIHVEKNEKYKIKMGITKQRLHMHVRLVAMTTTKMHRKNIEFVCFLWKIFYLATTIQSTMDLSLDNKTPMHQHEHKCACMASLYDPHTDTLTQYVHNEILFAVKVCFIWGIHHRYSMYSINTRLHNTLYLQLANTEKKNINIKCSVTLSTVCPHSKH